MKVLSLFDGMACGMLAMMESGIKVDRYVAFEIDKYAIKTSPHNFPMIEQRGDVFKADFTEFEGFDWLIAGFPCTKFSIAQKKDRETQPYQGEGWDLFFRTYEAINQVKPKFFLLENNKSMAKAVQEEISRLLGFEPVLINSALVSAQNRQRLYWVGRWNEDGTYSKVTAPQPEDRGILLKDILEDGCCVDRDKAYCLKHQAGNARDYFKKHHTQIKFEPLTPFVEAKLSPIVDKYGYLPEMFNPYNKAEITDKTPTLLAQGDTQTKSSTVMLFEPCIMSYPRGKNEGGAKYDKAPTLTASSWQTNNHLLEPLNITPEGKSQTIKAQYQNTSTVNICCYKSTYGASGVAEPVNPIKSGKNRCVTAGYSCKGAKHILESNYSDNPNKQQWDSVAEYVPCFATPTEWDENGRSTKARSCADGKIYMVYEVKDGKITIKDKEYPIKLPDGFYIIRKLTVRECMRLQTVPEWYEFPVSDSQAYKMLGNGWTVLVISHLINCVMSGKTESKIEQIAMF